MLQLNMICGNSLWRYLMMPSQHAKLVHSYRSFLKHRNQKEIYIACFSIALIKYHAQGNLEKQNYIQAYGTRGFESNVAGRHGSKQAQWQKLRAHIFNRHKTERANSCSSQLVISKPTPHVVFPPPVPYLLSFPKSSRNRQTSAQTSEQMKDVIIQNTLQSQ